MNFTFDETVMVEFLQYTGRFGSKGSNKISLWIECGETPYIWFMPTYGHMDFFKDKPKFSWIQEKLDSMNDELSQAYDDHIESIPEDEHPEWHVYEIWADNYKWEIMNEILEELASKHNFYRAVKYDSNKLIVSKFVKEEDLKNIRKFFDEYYIRIQLDTHS